MISMKWVGFFAAIWIIGTLLGATFDAQTTEAGTWGPEEEDTLQYLSDVKRIVYEEDETGALTWITPNSEYFSAIGTLITWDFSFLRCPDANPGCGYAYFRYIILTPLTIAAIFGIVILFVQIMQSIFALFA